MSRSSHRLEYGCNSRGGSAELLASVLPHASFSLDALCEAAAEHRHIISRRPTREKLAGLAATAARPLQHRACLGRAAH